MARFEPLETNFGPLGMLSRLMNALRGVAGSEFFLPSAALMHWL